MTNLKHIAFLVALFLSPALILAGNTVYRSGDETGHVTFSTEPPEDAVSTETRSDAQFEALTKRRQQEAQARRDAERLRLDREAAEWKRRIDEAAEDRAGQPSYYPVYPLYWGRPYPSRPPIHLPYPPEPSIGSINDLLPRSARYRPVFRWPSILLSTGCRGES